LNYNKEERGVLSGQCQRDRNGAILEFNQLWDICQLVRTLAKDIVRVRYQETTSENKLRRWNMCNNEKTSAVIGDSVVIT
jgi:hypothetical protein